MFVVVAAAASASPAQTVTRDCSLTVAERNYAYTRSVTVQAAGDDVRPGGIAHASVAGARETLPATSPYPQFLIGYSTLRISYAVTGGTIIPDSLVKTSDATINGFVVASSTAVLGSTIVTTVNGPIPPGDFVTAGFTVAVQAGAAGESIRVRAERATELVRYQTTLGGAATGSGECNLGVNLTRIDVTDGAPVSTAASTTTVAPTTTAAPTSTTTVPLGSAGPQVTVMDTSRPEPVKGEVDFMFEVNVQTPNGRNKGTVKYRVLDGTAVHKADFSQASGTLRFQDGRSTLWIKVKVKADKISDPNEVFYVELYDAKGGATIVRARATGTILNG